MDRRTFLRALPAGGVLLTGCLGGGGGGKSFQEYVSEANLYQGSVVDRTDADEVTIAVGAGENGTAFDPPALKVSTGTTVVWEWTGEGGRHNVVHEGGNFESKFYASEGKTFSKTFDSTGVVKYYCKPHQSVGMQGAIRVV